MCPHCRSNYTIMLLIMEEKQVGIDGNLEIRVLSSLEKVFADEELRAAPFSRISVLRNEVCSFQTAYRWHGDMQKGVKVSAISAISEHITIRTVGLMPSEMPCYADHDDNILRTTPGLYPDILMPYGDDGLTLLPGQWRSVWITVRSDGILKPGKYPIRIEFRNKNGEELSSEEFNLEILDAVLPKQTLLHTEWLHTDCISTWYGAEVFSPRYWELAEKYIASAEKHGVNMILTPIFTPPLDTAVGGERPTVQLIDVTVVNNEYRFGFENLERWIDICAKNGIGYFEFSHLFTQWGAQHAPKILADVDGKMERIFGWDTDASGPEYKKFLSQMLQELLMFIKESGLEDCCYFHVSDEPLPQYLKEQQSANEIVEKYLKDFNVIDAVSDFDIYKKSFVKTPVAAIKNIEPFIENETEDLWAYYSCSQYKNVSNRFFNMPSARNRIIGFQLYKFIIKGFLHWGLNFWYSQFSRYPIDPFKVTDAGYAFPSGDAFLVYPGQDGPIDSIRYEVFCEALQDLRALQMLEEKIGRDAVLDLIDEGLDSPLTFHHYPQEAEWILLKREQINRLIAE